MLSHIKILNHEVKDSHRVIKVIQDQKIELFPLKSGNILVQNYPGKITRHNNRDNPFVYRYGIWKRDNSQLGPYKVKDNSSISSQISEDEETKETVCNPPDCKFDETLTEKIRTNYQIEQFKHGGIRFLYKFSDNRTFLCKGFTTFYIWDNSTQELFATHFAERTPQLGFMPDDQIISCHCLENMSDYNKIEHCIIEFKHTEAAKELRKQLPGLLMTALTMFPPPLVRLVDSYVGVFDVPLENLATYYGPPVPIKRL